MHGLRRGGVAVGVTMGLFSAVLIGLIVWVLIAAAGRRSGVGAAAPRGFVPEVDPAYSTEVTHDPLRDSTLALPDGARVVVPRTAASQPVRVALSRLKNTPGGKGVERVLGPTYQLTLGENQQPDAGIEITVPVENSAAGVVTRRLALARWNGQEWRPISTRVDPATGKATARISHLSVYAMVETDRFEPGPASVHFPPLTESEEKGAAELERVSMPLGATAWCHVDGLAVLGAGERARVSAASGSGLDFGDGAGEFVSDQGVAELVQKNDGTVSARFMLRVRGDAALGDRHLTLDIGGNKLPLRPLAVVRPLVVIVDLDGMRRDNFDRLVGQFSEHHPNFRDLLGKPSSNMPAPGPLMAREYTNGISLLEASTIFPTVTTVGQASLFTGTDIRDVGLGGNQYFDRTRPEKYGFCGYDIADTARATHGQFVVGGEPLNGKLVRLAGINTVYEDAKAVHGVRSVVYNNMYAGDRKTAARWTGLSVIEDPQYVWVHSTWLVDNRMARAAAEDMTQYLRHPASEDHRLALVTLYFCGMDHLGHDGKEPAAILDRHRKYFGEVIDTGLGTFMNSLSDVMFKNTTFVISADHGMSDIRAAAPPGVSPEVRSLAKGRSQPYAPKISDLLYEFGYTPDGGALVQDAAASDGLSAVTIPVEKSTAVVGLNGGMAHVYLRREKEGHGPRPRPALATATELKESAERAFEAWNQPPRWVQTLEAASMFDTWSREGWEPTGLQARGVDYAAYRGSLEMILVRNTETVRPGDNTGFRVAPYKVYLGGDRTADIAEFLQTPEGQKVMVRNGWSTAPRDAQFLADRILRCGSVLTGDLILIPHYPQFFCELADLMGDHGGIARWEFEVPFVIARPGADERDIKRFREILAETVRIDPPGPGARKDRPSTTDLKSTVLALLRTPKTPALAGRPSAMQVRVFVDAGSIVGKIDEATGITGTVGVTQGKRQHEILPAACLEEVLGVHGFVSDPKTRLSADGAPVVVEWLGRKWHTRTAPAGGMGDEPGMFDLDLPLARGSNDLKVTATCDGVEISRTIKVIYTPRSTEAAAREDSFKTSFVTAEKIGRMLAERNAELEKQFADARKSNNPAWIDRAFQSRKHEGIQLLVQNVPHSLALAARAGHGAEALALWKAALDGHKTAFGEEPLTIARSAAWLAELQQYNQNVSGFATLLFYGAAVQWQAGDLDGAQQTLEAYRELMLTAFARRWISPLTSYRADPSFQLSLIAMQRSGDLRAAVVHFEEFAKRYYEAEKEANQGLVMGKPAGPIWYPAERDIPKILGGAAQPGF